MAASYSPSAALLRTVRNEIDRLERALAALEGRRAAMVAQMTELDAEVEAYRHRRQLLEDLGEVEKATPTAQVGPRGAVVAKAIKGRRLREVAGRLLWSWQGAEQIHYRQWFERVLAEGYAIGGKDPVASFLTNVRDSPAVTRGSQQGYYRLDPSSVERIEQAMDELKAELADVQRSIEHAYGQAARAESTSALREHRDRLGQQIKRREADLREVRHVFAAAASGDDQLAPETAPLRAA
jgi:hypothetical protein